MIEGLTRERERERESEDELIYLLGMSMTGGIFDDPRLYKVE